ncbi:MAG: YjbH domain-containing protein [Rhodovarius sp.]|nr:YjbH domain-containing protein [Rhodovarius sp.]MCX7933170.1 YjbH domain-containing protein [Rhodovarius sp.]MDW8314179.1 YjbH domain-containing protein [Rhodovarius sp.]
MRRARAAAALCLLLLAEAGSAPPARAEEAIEPSGSNFGGAGLIEMRNARMRPDGTIETGISLRRDRSFWFVSWQALPFLEATFRIADRLNATRGFGRSSDRAFDLRLRLLTEDAWRPAVVVGLQDAIGTGIYAGEYVVASKRFWDLDLSLGLGWGRLGTGGDLRNPLGLLHPAFETRPRRVGQGGLPGIEGLFRGPRAGIFAGAEYALPPISTPAGRLSGLRLKLEYSADALRDERGGYPARTTGLTGLARSRVHAGLAWQTEHFEFGAAFVHGSDAIFRIAARLDPHAPPLLLPRPPSPPLAPRPAPVAAWSEASVAAALFPALREAGFRPIGLEIRGLTAVIAVSGGRYRSLAQVAGRVLRAAQPHLPAEVERVEVIWQQEGAAIGRIALLRGGFEAAARGAGSAEEIHATAEILPARPFRSAFAAAPLGLSWGVEPRLNLVVGDPTAALRYQAGVAAGARLSLGGGFALAGSVQQILAQNLDAGLPSDSVLPRVRSDFARYAREGRTSLPALYLEGLWNPAPDWYARLTAGLLEPMFAGLSGELLWRPAGGRLALGVDLNWVRQRDYAQGFGLLPYRVWTGHASLYWDTPWWNSYAVLRAGRYLAGDWGGTIELGRRFDNGIEVGGFATFTNVPFRRFGEGSFDKGIYLRIPLDVFGPATRARVGLNLRPVQRDGGQRLVVDHPLWDLSREGSALALGRGYLGFLR